MLAGIVDQLSVFLAPRGIQHQCVFLHDHFGETDDGIERRAQLVAHGGEEAALGDVGLFGGGARQIKGLFLNLTVGDVAHDSHHLGLCRSLGAGRPTERPAAHFDPDEIDRVVRAVLTVTRPITPHAKLNAVFIVTTRRIGQCGEISRTVGNMDTFEQAVAQ